MNKLLRNLIFGPPNYLYIKVFSDRMELIKIGDEIKTITLNPTENYSTHNLLIGEISVADNLLRNGFKKVAESKFLSKGPLVVIQPMEMVGKELSEVENRILLELAYGAGAFRVAIWNGKELSNDEVIEKAKNV
jgi:hypothetical protein